MKSFDNYGCSKIFRMCILVRSVRVVNTYLVKSWKLLFMQRNHVTYTFIGILENTKNDNNIAWYTSFEYEKKLIFRFKKNYASENIVIDNKDQKTCYFVVVFELALSFSFGKNV